MKREDDFRNLPSWIKHNIKMKVPFENGTIEELPTDASGIVDFRGVTRSSRAKVRSINPTQTGEGGQNDPRP